MDTLKKIGIVLIAVAVVVGLFGLWIKLYNDRIAQVQINDTGTCYLPDGTCLHATSDSILYAAIGIAIFMAAIGVYMIFFRKKDGKLAETLPENAEKRVIAADTSKLSPELKQIYDIITENNGAVLQGAIVEKSGIDKVKVSRLLDKLEMLGFVERRRHGMSNIVTLKKK
ncbi:MAG: MarR family transcriptional regulator [Candidatus Aenigmarchaeota archaeon]|nr:MarR family transcriptional regulator [Candidatus Aenigmarchaeota archaeon]